MQMFEYRTTFIHEVGQLEEILNARGREGWELVTVLTMEFGQGSRVTLAYEAFFKRPLVSA